MVSHRRPANLRIVHLLEAPGAAATLARWFVEEWAVWYGPGGPGNAETDLESCRSRDALPICLVAFDGDGAVQGTAALRSNSVGSELGVGPWLAALLVGRAHRGRGVATALVGAIEREARRLGCRAVYASTNIVEHLLMRRGWEAIGTAPSPSGPLTVYRLPLR